MRIYTYLYAYVRIKIFICIHAHIYTCILGEVESLRVKNATLRDRKQVQRDELDESKDRVAALRTELKSVEATLDSEKVHYYHHHHHHHFHYITL